MVALGFSGYVKQPEILPPQRSFKTSGENSGRKVKPVPPLQKVLAFERGKVSLSVFVSPDRPRGTSGLFLYVRNERILKVSSVNPNCYNPFSCFAKIGFCDYCEIGL